MLTTLIVIAVVVSGPIASAWATSSASATPP